MADCASNLGTKPINWNELDLVYGETPQCCCCYCCCWQCCCCCFDRAVSNTRKVLQRPQQGCAHSVEGQQQQAVHVGVYVQLGVRRTSA